MRRPAIVIVTFKRQELLAQLFESIKKLTVPAWRVVVVDNENSPRTAQMARARRFPAAETGTATVPVPQMTAAARPPPWRER